MDRSKEWLAGTDAQFKTLENTWAFPSGAKLAFGYLDTEKDKFRYQGAEFQFIGFDEVTQFTEDQYRYLFSRLRRLENSYIPLRMRAASNPGGVGHDWVKRRFIIEGPSNNRVFVPAKLQENPYLDQEGYIESLNQLDPITRRQYLEGDWNARHGGSMFVREKAEIIPQAPANLEQTVCYIDKAATKPKENNKDPDYTAILFMGIKNGVTYILKVIRVRKPPQDVENLISQTAQLHGKQIPYFMEQEPGSSGVDVIDHYTRTVFLGYKFKGVKSTGSKAERAGAFATQWMAGGEGSYGNVKIVQGAWNSEYLDELEAFPLGGHDDQVDVSSGAFNQLTNKPKPNASFLLL